MRRAAEFGALATVDAGIGGREGHAGFAPREHIGLAAKGRHPEGVDHPMRVQHKLGPGTGGQAEFIRRDDCSGLPLLLVFDAPPPLFGGDAHDQPVPFGAGRSHQRQGIHQQPPQQDHGKEDAPADDQHFGGAAAHGTGVDARDVDEQHCNEGPQDHRADQHHPKEVQHIRRVLTGGGQHGLTPLAAHQKQGGRGDCIDAPRVLQGGSFHSDNLSMSEASGSCPFDFM